MSDEKKTKTKKVTKSNERKPRGASRFTAMHNDPRFAPVDGRTAVTDKRFGQMLDPSFVMLQTSNNAKGQKTEHFMKNQLKNIYKFDKTAKNSKIVDELKREAELAEREKKGGEDIEDDSDSDEESTALTRESLNLKVDKEAEEEADDQEEDEMKEKEYSFDDFLSSLKNRPGFEDDNDDDVFNFEENDEPADEEAMANLDAETEQILQNDVWNKITEEAPTVEDGEETRRLAVMNFDWSIIDSTDIFAVLQSMCPPGGKLLSVTVYLSEYGKKKLDEEKTKGPDVYFSTEEEYKEYKQMQEDFAKENEVRKVTRFFNKEGRQKEYHPERFNRGSKREKVDMSHLDPLKVREYEFNRLKYYFAAAEFDSKATAVHVYDEADGWEIESTGLTLDLRFIPDDVSFAGKEIRNQCTKLPVDYKPKQNTFAQQLQNTDVELTWDQDDPNRAILKSNDFSKISELDLQKFIASSSDSSSSDSEDESAKKKKKKGKKKVTKKSKKAAAQAEEAEAQESAEAPAEVAEPAKQVEAETTEKTDKKPKKVKKEKKEKKKKVNKYAELLAVAKERENILNKTEKEGEVTEMTFDESIKEAAKEIVKQHQQKEKAENESWWETVERKRKEKKKELKKQRKDTFTKANGEEEDDEMIIGGSSEKKNKADKQEEEEKERVKLQLLLDGYKTSESGEVGSFNLKRESDKERSRRKAGKQNTIRENDDFQLDLADERLGKLLDDPDFQIDPTHHKFKKTKNMDKILQAKKSKKDLLDDEQTAGQKSQQKAAPSSSSQEFSDDKLNSLYKSLKRKSESSTPEKTAKKQKTKK